MTLETERPTFRGVVCLHCKAPVPVPAIVRSLQAASGEENRPSENPRSLTFGARPATRKNLTGPEKLSTLREPPRRR